ncbi:MAG: hypothetical protein WBC47_06655, partial [Dehalococcoidia bacterium]
VIRVVTWGTGGKELAGIMRPLSRIVLKRLVQTGVLVGYIIYSIIFSRRCELNLPTFSQIPVDIRLHKCQVPQT